MPSFRESLQAPPDETFSDVWYRVSESRPRLSVHARFIRQTQGPTVRYVVEDPAGGSYYRLSEAARFYAGMLDGNRTADDAWRACLAQLGDEAPTQRECIELLAQLQLYGLLTGDEPLAADMIAERHHRFRANRLKQRTGNWLFYNIPLWNPEPLLNPLRALLRLAWGLPGLLIFLALAAWALFELVTNSGRLGSSFNSVLDPANVIWLGVFFMLIRFLHELGHAAACKAMGGRCTEIGVMLIAMILPLPYCDASSSWRFSETWRRVLVALGGILVELVLASIATIVWAHSEPGLARTLAFNIMVISGATTFIFNLNPLLRYDGYYILSDLVGSPNLASRSKELWKHLVLTRLFGVTGNRPPAVRGPGEARFMLLYHALAVPYRISVVTAILLVILGQYVSLGIVLAALFSFMWLAMPIISACWYLLTSPQLVGRRPRAIAVTLAIFGPLVAGILWLPLPSSVRVPAVVDWADLHPLRAGADGYLRSMNIAPGETAQANQVIFTFENPTLLRDRDAALARLKRAQAVLSASAADAPVTRRVARAHVDLAESDLAELQRRVDALSVSSPVPGIIASPRAAGHDLEQSIGRYVNRGEILAYLLPDTGPSLLAAITDKQSPRIVPLLEAGTTEATVRLRGAAGTEIDAVVSRVWPAGTRELPSTALAASTGGGVLQDPDNPRRSLSPLTQIELRPEPNRALLQGRRGKVRFALPAEPAWPRIARSVRTLIDARLGR